MQGQYLQMMEDLVKLAGLVMLARGAIAFTRPRPAVSVAPTAELVLTVQPSTGRRGGKKQGRETEEFEKLPLYIQRQALGYAQRWMDANFEPEEQENGF